MARAPRQETITVPANGRVPWGILGRWILILSNTAASVDVAFDNDAFTPMTAGIPYPASDGQYRQVTFRDSLGAGCTLQVIFSDDQCPDNRGSPLMAHIDATLVSIDASLLAMAPGTDLNQIDPTIIPVSPAVAVHLVTAVAGLKQIMLQAGGGVAQTDTVYLGEDATVDDAHHFAELAPGQSIAVPHNVDVWARCAAGAAAFNEVHGYAAT